MAGAQSELKAWAKENMKGLENATIPSFTPDFSDIDEEGVRWDVQQAIKHGFFSTLCASEVGLTLDEAKKFVSIVADEAKGKILAATTLIFNSFEQNIEMLKHAQKAGCSHVLLGWPPTFLPKSEDEAFEAAKKVCSAAPDVGVVLYTTHKLNFEHLNPAGLSPELLERLSGIENVVGIKAGSNDFSYIADIFRRCGDKVQVNTPLLGLSPVMHQAYKQQWIGAATYEIYQSPEKRYAVDAFNLVLKGEYDQAVKMIESLAPVQGIFESQMMPTIILGSYHWALLKFYQWCVGGNGGLVRSSLRIFSHQLMATKMAFRAIGINPSERDEEFIMGRANFAKMK